MRGTFNDLDVLNLALLRFYMLCCKETTNKIDRQERRPHIHYTRTVHVVFPCSTLTVRVVFPCSTLTVRVVFPCSTLIVRVVFPCSTPTLHANYTRDDVKKVVRDFPLIQV